MVTIGVLINEFDLACKVLVGTREQGVYESTPRRLSRTLGDRLDFVLRLEQTELIFGKALHIDLPIVVVLIQLVCNIMLLLTQKVLN